MIDEELQALLEKALFRISVRFQNELILTVPVDTGRLRNSIKVRSTEKGLIIWMADYGKFVEFGTNPHIIKPTEKKALKFKSGGNVVFAKQVKHPGTRPNPFVRNAINNKLRGIIIEEMIKVSK